MRAIIAATGSPAASDAADPVVLKYTIAAGNVVTAVKIRLIRYITVILEKRSFDGGTGMARSSSLSLALYNPE